MPLAGPADTARYLAGAFELGADGSWRERYEVVYIAAGVESERRVFESGGRYRVAEDRPGSIVLDLYPGQVLTANLAPTAVLRGDTLYHSAFVYAP